MGGGGVRPLAALHPFVLLCFHRSHRDKSRCLSSPLPQSTVCMHPGLASLASALIRARLYLGYSIHPANTCWVNSWSHSPHSDSSWSTCLFIQDWGLKISGSYLGSPELVFSKVIVHPLLSCSETFCPRLCYFLKTDPLNPAPKSWVRGSFGKVYFIGSCHSSLKWPWSVKYHDCHRLSCCCWRGKCMHVVGGGE